MSSVKEFEYEYNPVKEMKGQEKAKAVVWSTKSINMALDAIKKGLPLKANPFIGNNTKLLKPELVYKRTEEEVEDYMRCMEDVLYFATKCYLMTPEGLQSVKLRDYQVEYLKQVSENRFNIFLSCRQSGKSTTTAIYCLWYCLFKTDINGLILSKSGPAGIDLVSKIKDMFTNLPYYLKPGITKWNQHEIAFDSNSTIHTEAFSETAGLGQTINFLILDEFAWTPPNQNELFYENVVPTVTTMPNSKVCIMSTQNGFNLFYKLWTTAIKGKSVYKPFKVDWWQVPNWNPDTKVWEKRDEQWKEMMIGVLGSESAFYYQYGTQFSASDYCLVSRRKMSEIHDQQVNFENKDINIQFQDNLYWHPDFDFEELKNGFFFILVDLAEGGGGDYTVFHIFQMTDKNHFKQVGYWRSNIVGLEFASVQFWYIYAQLFNNDRCLISIEWNTYGALFYRYIIDLNEEDSYPEFRQRFQLAPDGIELNNIIYYNRNIMESGIELKQEKKALAGIKFTSSNKITACAMLKMYIENNQIEVFDIETITELENFEDKSGNGSYKASFGHDDIIMTMCQLPLLMRTAAYQNQIEEFLAAQQTNQGRSEEAGFYDMQYYTPYGENPYTLPPNNQFQGSNDDLWW